VGPKKTVGKSLVVLLAPVVLGTGGLVRPESATAPVPGEVHAPRIPGPAPAPAPASRPGALAIRQWTSKNWSGYATTGAGFTSVSGTWHVPQVQAPTKKRHYRRNTFSSSWVGIDGFNNNSLIQAGTEEDWLNGSAIYQAWWEILPAAETPIPSMTIHPGDAMTVQINRGFPDWTISVSDQTTGQSFTTKQVYSGPLTSAEWIHEAPTVGRRVATLSPDSADVFDLATVNSGNPGLTAADAGAMFKGRHQISTPSAPDSDGDGFTVANSNVAPSPPPS
jgi:Peptidase A4 family